MRTSSALLLGACLLLCAIPLQGASGRDPVIVMEPELLSSSISSVADPPGKGWIRTEFTIFMVVSSPIEDVVEVLEAYEEYPSIFTRISSVEVTKLSSGEVDQTQSAGFDVLGLSYRLKFTNRLAPPQWDANRTRYRLSFHQVGANGSVRGIAGRWDLATRSLAEGSGTRVTYTYTSESLNIVGAQKAMMKLILPAEASLVLVDVAKTIGRRHP